MVLDCVYIIVRIGELTMSEEKGRVAPYSLVKKLHCFKIIFSSAREVNEAVVDEFFCSQVEIVGNEIRSGALTDYTLFLWRQFGLKLVGDFFGNLALDGENIGQVAIIFFGPDMRVIAGINQLGAHPDTI